MKTRVRFRPWRERWNRLLRRKSVRIGAIQLTADPALVGRDVQRLLFRGDYEFAELQLVGHVLRPEDRVLEIGAGTGAVGLTAAAAIGAERVTSFEANPALERVIRKNYELNGLFPALEMKAVTADGSPVEFNVTESLLSSSVYDRGEHRTITVESVEINDAIARVRPTVLVVDAEGAEVDILPATDLDGIRAVLVETHANLTGKDAVEDMVDNLKHLGFVVEIELHRNLLLVRHLGN